MQNCVKKLELECTQFLNKISLGEKKKLKVVICSLRAMDPLLWEKLKSKKCQK